MGQYYVVANATKGEYISPLKMEGGSKLLEFGYRQSDTMNALMNLLTDRWRGDKVFIVGDYAEPDNPDEPCHETLKRLSELYGLEEKGRRLYGYIHENFCDISGTCDTGICNCRYLVNPGTRQYIDLAKLPVEDVWYDPVTREGFVDSIHPLAVLLAMGNGRGGGDYRGINSGLAGSWCATSEHIRIVKNLHELSEDTGGFREFSPDFTERNPLVPYSRGPEMLADAILKEKLN